jgi:mannan endo-1,4-beta-mannosidase
MRRFGFLFAVLALTVFSASSVQAAINVTYTVKTDTGQTPISKYIYGSNWGNNTNYTIQRTGGNRCTAYNWENNWSNAGSDWYYENDQMFDPTETPGLGITKIVDQFNLQGQESIITLQLAGYVSAPIFGMNLDQYPAPSQYFTPVQFAKGTPFCDPPGNPDVCDGVVYMDEFVNLLVGKYGPAGSPQGVKFYCLDNEVDIWHATHKEVHPAHILCQELKNKSIDCASAVKNVDPNAQIMGPVLCTFVGFQSLDNAPDWSSVKGSRPWFISYYLDEMKKASDANGRRLLDVLDVHWYPPEDDGNGHGITTDGLNDPRLFNARMQAPRTLWDTDYVTPHETYPDGGSSWVNKWWNAPFLPVLTRFKADIQNYFPDTNIAITEYSYGPSGQWATGITTADFLGICGKYGVYITNYWGQGGYIDAAVKIFRNYDGFHSTYGDTNVPATMSDKVNSSIYASIFDSNNNVLHMIVLNKNLDNDINGTFNITSSHNFTSGRIWAFDVNGSDILEMRRINNITSNTFKYLIPRLSVCHIVLDGPPCPMNFQCELTENCYVDKAELEILLDQWLNLGDCSANPQCADFNGDEIVDFEDFALMGKEWKL